MPLIVVCGRPCTGKTRFALQLRERILAQDGARAVLLVNDEALGVDKGAGYASAREEKVSRGRHKAAVERALAAITDGGGGPPVIIADGLNYIKGYRYELWCLARAVGAAYACVWVEPTVVEGSAAALDGGRGSAGYPPSARADLWTRFEPPDGRNKWDAPLYRVATGTLPPPVAGEGAGAALAPVFTSRWGAGDAVYSSAQLGAAGGLSAAEIAERARMARAVRASSYCGASTGVREAGISDIADLRDFDGLEVEGEAAAAPATRMVAQAAARPSAFARAGKLSAFSRAGVAAQPASLSLSLSALPEEGTQPTAASADMAPDVAAAAILAVVLSSKGALTPNVSTSRVVPLGPAWRAEMSLVLVTVNTAIAGVLGQCGGREVAVPGLGTPLLLPPGRPRPCDGDLARLSRSFERQEGDGHAWAALMGTLAPGGGGGGSVADGRGSVSGGVEGQAVGERYIAYLNAELAV